MKGFEVGKAIYTILYNDSTVKGFVNNKIFPIIADDGTKFPFIFYKRNSITPATSKDRYIYNTSVTEQITICSTDYNESINIASAVTDALLCANGTYNGVDIVDIKLDGADEAYLEDTFIQTLTFKIQVN